MDHNGDLLKELGPEEAKRCLSSYRDAAFADFLTVAVGLAAMTNPEEIRKALGSVFDMSAVEESTKRAMLLLTNVQKATAEIRDEQRRELQALQEAIHADIGTLERRMTALQQAVKGLEFRVTKAAKMVGELLKAAKS